MSQNDSGQKAPEKTRDYGVRLACQCVCCVAPHLTTRRVCHRTLSTQVVIENECRFSLTSFGVSPPGGVKSRQDWPQALAAFFRSSLARPSNMPKLCIGKTSQYQGEKGEHEGPYLSSDKAERTEMSPSLSATALSPSLRQNCWGCSSE